MRSELSTAHEATDPILRESSLLMQRREQVDRKSDVLRRFKEHFVLSDEEVNRLTLPSEPIDDHFFATLSKAKKIQRDCELLLGSGADGDVVQVSQYLIPEALQMATAGIQALQPRNTSVEHLDETRSAIPFRETVTLPELH